MNKKIYEIPDMSCAHCKARIEKEVTGLEGILKANVSLADKVLAVDYDENIVDNQAIIDAVSEAGYTATEQ